MSLDWAVQVYHLSLNEMLRLPLSQENLRTKEATTAL
jgi:hypothetical protein